MADDRDTALLDAELAELWGLPYSYWRAAVNTTYAKTVTESPPGRRTSRLTVSVIERAPGSEDMRVSLTLRRPWGVSYLRRTLVIAPTGRVEPLSDDEAPVADGRPGAADFRQHLRVTGLPPGTWQQGQAVHEAPFADVSVGGCYILQSLGAAPAGRIGVQLCLPSQDDPIRVSATVVHAQPGLGFGVQFTDLRHTHRQALDRTVTLLQPGRVP